MARFCVVKLRGMTINSTLFFFRKMMLAWIILHCVINVPFISSLHIVFVLADDLGWGDVYFANQESTIRTPTLSHYASKGIILDNYYVQPICTPTRASLMSGRYPIHVGLQHGVIRDSVPDALPLHIHNKSVMLLPEYLKQHANYETHMIGKWHLGFYLRKYTPQERGFDHFYGYYTGNEEYWNHTSPCWNCGNFTAIDLGYHNATTDIFDSNQSGLYSTTLFSQHAVEVIKTFSINHANDSKQLFLYLPFEAVHGAASCDPDCAHPSGDLLQAPQYYIDQQSHINNTNRRIYGGMLGALDDAIKNITEALKEGGLWNDTLFIFSTDNGAPASHFNAQAMSNYPLRGQKGQLWEGGIRGPAFIYSPLFELKPNEYKSGYRYKGLMHVSDWYVTFAGLVNASIDRLQDLDGYNMWNALIKNDSSPRTEILHNIDPIAGNSAIRSGKWKLLQGVAPAPWFPMYRMMGNVSSKIYLYDIESDPTEHVNQVANHSDIVRELQNKIKLYQDTMLSPQNSDPDPNAQQLIASMGFWYSWQELNL
eukprot:19580_1